MHAIVLVHSYSHRCLNNGSSWHSLSHEEVTSFWWNNFSKLKAGLIIIKCQDGLLSLEYWKKKRNNSTFLHRIHVKALGLPPASITEHVIPGLVPDEQKKTIYQILTEDNESFKELPLLPMDVINKPLRAEEELPSKPTAFYDQRKFQHESNYAASIRAEQKRAADGGNLNYLFGK
ncbi:unnamed protein product [Amoebophrya sp. A25]|nr:unnamed protein product [Amoebophrya sp. A25]|eukprot:GSA25T00018401001.1